MNRALSWDDLFLQDSSLDFVRILSCWPQLDFGRIRPIGLSAFGDCFFERSDGTIHVLDTLHGRVYQVATSMDEFTTKMNSPQWQEEHLMSAFLAQLLENGLSRGPGQVIGFAPHPAFTGKLSAGQAMALDPIVWHSIAGQIFSDMSPEAQQ